MTIEVRLLLLLREFARDRGQALDESSLATLQIPMTGNKALDVPIVELMIAEAACTP